ncbi:hypothetical protein BAUCODRAFT_488181 [Baudoinia panamericana UAMH 10762]|uniref:Uncharacterized protein n=1 Tax=Baudoinia panamericana (strain UAMH 10762) TaxID=717646 RepID=M2MYQ5_BAUPA|nr:uncharacterized protein BAUCODRAFT_488181 [Baudoinia panamericana UAMH 10762]EMC96743.1 hypothetical protein BAUCODRAFT_488181 [Baudoinia panamericana UAMH 10762]
MTPFQRRTARQVSLSVDQRGSCFALTLMMKLLTQCSLLWADSREASGLSCHTTVVECTTVAVELFIGSAMHDHGLNGEAHAARKRDLCTRRRLCASPALCRMVHTAQARQSPHRAEYEL